MSRDTQFSTSVPSNWLDSLPSADEPPPKASNRADHDALRSPRVRTVGRRQLLRSGLAIASVVALNAVGRVPGFRLPRAYATVGTEHLNCAGYSTWAGYDNNTQLCVGGTYGSSYCGSDGWFKNSTVGGTTYYYPIVICGEGVTDRNAWRWTHSVAGTSRQYRCADGMMRLSSGAYAFRICAYGF